MWKLTLFGFFTYPVIKMNEIGITPEDKPTFTLTFHFNLVHLNDNINNSYLQLSVVNKNKKG